MQAEQSLITIDGEALLLKTMRLYDVGTDTLVDEFGSVSPSDGTRVTLVGHWVDSGLAHEDFLDDRATLLQVMGSYRSDP